MRPRGYTAEMGEIGLGTISSAKRGRIEDHMFASWAVSTSFGRPGVRLVKRLEDRCRRQMRMS